MPESIPEPTDIDEQARRRRVTMRTMRSFRWPLVGGAEIAPCPDCSHWHAIVEDDSGPDGYGPDLYLREWHDGDCPCWEGA